MIKTLFLNPFLQTFAIVFMVVFCLQNACAQTEVLEDEDVLFSQDLDPDLVEENSHLSADESIKDVARIAKERQDDSDDENLSPRDFLLRAKAKSAAVNAILHRNYKEPEDEFLKEEKKLFNADMARMNGGSILNNKNNGAGFSPSTMLEAGLSNSFDKKNRKKKSQHTNSANSNEPIFLRDYRAEVIKRRQEKAEKKGDGNSAQYRNQAGSFSDAFKK